MKVGEGVSVEDVRAASLNDSTSPIKAIDSNAFASPIAVLSGLTLILYK